MRYLQTHSHSHLPHLQLINTRAVFFSTEKNDGLLRARARSTIESELLCCPLCVGPRAMAVHGGPGWCTCDVFCALVYLTAGADRVTTAFDQLTIDCRDATGDGLNRLEDRVQYGRFQAMRIEVRHIDLLCSDRNRERIHKRGGNLSKCCDRNGEINCTIHARNSCLYSSNIHTH